MALQTAILLSHLQLAMFLASMGIMEGCDAQHIRGKFKDLYGQAIIANWQVWPLVQVYALEVLSFLADCPSSLLTFVSCPCRIGSRSKVHVGCSGHCTSRCLILRKPSVQSSHAYVLMGCSSENVQQDRRDSMENVSVSA
jgi:hypothetical protein